MRHLRRSTWAPIVCVLLSCGGSNPLDQHLDQSPGAGGTSAGGTSAAGADGTSAAGAPGAGGYAGGLPACAKSAGPNIVHPLDVTCTGGDIDSSNLPCNSDSDCAVDGGSPGRLVKCLNHMCAAGACFRNEDCPGHGVCECAQGIHFYNTCYAADCRSDADCGAGGICQATFIPSCASGPMYTCLRAADTCCSAADCPPGGVGCQFFPTLGHFQCAAAPMCLGGG
jgi:hypothetical protein